MQSLLSHLNSSTVRKLSRRARFQANRTEEQRKHDEKWAQKVLKMAVKKLRKDKALRGLERAVTSEDPSTPCVLYSITEEERIDAGSMNHHPHYIFCKLWRFPELATFHQLQPVPHCLFPFDRNHHLAEFCVNPYHYERIADAVLPSILVPLADPNFTPPPLDKRNPSDMDRLYPNGVPNRTITSSQVAAAHNQPGPYPRAPDSVVSVSPAGTAYSSASSPQGYMTDDMEVDLSPSAESNRSFVLDAQQARRPNQQRDLPQSQPSSGGVSPVFNQPQPIPGPSNAFAQPSSSHSSYAAPSTSTYNKPLLSNQSQRSAEYERDVLEQRRLAQLASQAVERPTGAPEISVNEELLNMNIGGNKFASVEFQDPPFWCQASYYERNKRVGNAFQASSPSFVIDAETSAVSGEERFSLGVLENAGRSYEVNNTRKHIGRGARFYYVGGEVFCECLSDSPIFIQSPNVAHRYGWHPATVCKIPPKCNLKVFNMAEFAKLLSTAVKNGFDSAFSLTRMCMIRMSFVKGWGTEYRRRTVIETPCWVEIHLNAPLQWLDRVLGEMGDPSHRCTSFT